MDTWHSDSECSDFNGPPPLFSSLLSAASDTFDSAQMAAATSGGNEEEECTWVLTWDHVRDILDHSQLKVRLNSRPTHIPGLQ